MDPGPKKDRADGFPPFVEQQALAAQLDILRQLVVLSMGPNDPLYLLINDALRTLSVQKMRKATQAFEDLPPTSERTPWVSTATKWVRIDRRRRPLSHSSRLTDHVHR